MGYELTAPLFLLMTALLAGTPIFSKTSQSPQTWRYVPGQIFPHPDHSLEIKSPYSGLVTNVYKQAGEYVEAGTKLASIEGNIGSQNFKIISPIAGRILHRSANAGQVIHPTDVIFHVANPKKLWAAFYPTPEIASTVSQGDLISVSSQANQHTIQGRIVYIAPVLSSKTQTVTIYSEINNENKRWLINQMVLGAFPLRRP